MLCNNYVNYQKQNIVNRYNQNCAYHYSVYCIPMHQRNKNTSFFTSKGHGPQRTTTHGLAPHPLGDVSRKQQAGYRGESAHPHL